MASPCSNVQFIHLAMIYKALASLCPQPALRYFTLPKLPVLQSHWPLSSPWTQFSYLGIFGLLFFTILSPLAVSISSFSLNWHIPSPETTSLSTQSRVALPCSSLSQHPLLSFYGTYHTVIVMIFMIFVSVLFSALYTVPELCLEHSRCSINIYLMKNQLAVLSLCHVEMFANIQDYSFKKFLICQLKK